MKTNIILVNSHHSRKRWSIVCVRYVTKPSTLFTYNKIIKRGSSSCSSLFVRARNDTVSVIMYFLIASLEQKRILL